MEEKVREIGEGRRKRRTGKNRGLLKECMGRGIGERKMKGRGKFMGIGKRGKGGEGENGRWRERGVKEEKGR